MRFDINSFPEHYQKQIINKTKEPIKSVEVEKPRNDIDKPEKELQRECNAYLRALKDRQEILDFFHLKEARGNKIGLPDLLIFFENSKILFIELKTAKGKLTKEQKEFEKRCKQFSSDFYVCRDMKTVIEIVKKLKE